jgi:hypothetical protein
MLILYIFLYRYVNIFCEKKLCIPGQSEKQNSRTQRQWTEKLCAISEHLNVLNFLEKAGYSTVIVWSCMQE